MVEDRIEVEDGGQALIFAAPENTPETGGDGCFFVRLQSWNEAAGRPLGRRHESLAMHPLFHEMIGKRIRITVETVED